MRPLDLPPPDRHPHGTRARYVAAKCRCEPCRQANREYERARAAARARGESNGLVDPRPVVHHLRALSRQGVGYKSVAEACDVAASTLADIRSGKARHVRRQTALRILSVTAEAAADHACIDARPTWKLVGELVRRGGLTLSEISFRLGHQFRGLQLGKKTVFARTALHVRRLHAEVMADLDAERAVPDLCDECGYSHALEERIAVLRRMLPCAKDELVEAHPCWWGGEIRGAGERRMYRDLKMAGALRTDGVWALPLLRAA